MKEESELIFKVTRLGSKKDSITMKEIENLKEYVIRILPTMAGALSGEGSARNALSGCR